MTAHPGINKISFTGSTATGRKIMESCSSNLKRITLELGGNDPAIVLTDVDIEETAKEVLWAAFQNRSESHTLGLQSLMLISYAVLCCKYTHICFNYLTSSFSSCA